MDARKFSARASKINNRRDTDHLDQKGNSFYDANREEQEILRRHTMHQKTISDFRHHKQPVSKTQRAHFKDRSNYLNKTAPLSRPSFESAHPLSSSQAFRLENTQSLQEETLGPPKDLQSLQFFIDELKNLRGRKDFLSTEEMHQLWAQCSGGSELSGSGSLPGQEGRGERQRAPQTTEAKQPTKSFSTTGGRVKFTPSQAPRLKNTERRSSSSTKAPQANIKYKYSKTLVCPPSDWDPSLLVRSSQKPEAYLELDHVYGYKPSGICTNLYAAPDGSFIIYTVAAVAVVQSYEEGKPEGEQRFFRGHDDDISCLAIDNAGELAATGQVGKPCYVSVWDIQNQEEHCTLGKLDKRHAKKFHYQRLVCQVAFSPDGQFLIGIGNNDDHSMAIWHVETGSILGDLNCGKSDIYAIAWCPSWTQETKDIDRVDRIVVAGDSKFIKFWSVNISMGDRRRRRRPKPDDGQQSIGTARSGSFGAVTHQVKKKNKKIVFRAVVYATWDSVTCFVASDHGQVYQFTGPIAMKSFMASRREVFSLACSEDYLYAGGGDGRITRWEVSADGGMDLSKEYSVKVQALGDVAPPQKDGDKIEEYKKSSEETPQNKKPSARKSSKSLSLTQNTVAHKLRQQKQQAARAASNSTFGVVKVMDIAVLPGGDFESGHTVVYGNSRAEICTLNDEDGQSPVIRSKAHSDEVHGVASHPFEEGIFVTAGDDYMLIVWNAHERQVEAARRLSFKARMPAMHPDGTHIAVGGFTPRMEECESYMPGKTWEKEEKDAALGIYTYPDLTQIHFRSDGDPGQKEEIEELKYSSKGHFLAVANHDNYIYMYNVPARYQLIKRLKGHSSYVTHLDWCEDGKRFQSNCGAYEILYWDAEKGKQIRNTTDDIETDAKWATWTCVLGFPVMGIWKKDCDGTDINAVDRSWDERYVVTADDFGGVKIFNYPCVATNAPHRRYQAHSSHVKNIRFLANDTHVISVGAADLAVMQWSVIKEPPENSDDEDPESDDDQGPWIPQYPQCSTSKQKK